MPAAPCVRPRVAVSLPSRSPRDHAPATARPSRPCPRAWTVLLLGVLASGCPYGPPIVGAPPDPESAPFHLPEDVSPPNTHPVAIDLTQPGEAVFDLRNVYDPTGAVLRYRWSFSLAGETRTWELGGGQLQPRLEQPFPDLVVYDVPEERLLRCAFPLEPQYSPLVVRLEILKDLPPGLELLPGLQSFTTTVSWSLVLEGECDDP